MAIIGNVVNQEAAAQEESGPVYRGKSAIEGEVINLRAEPSQMFKRTPAVPESFKLIDVPTQIHRKISIAADEGHLHQTMAHYAKALEEAIVLNPADMATFKALAAESHEKRFDEAASKIVFKKVSELLTGLKTTRRR